MGWNCLTREEFFNWRNRVVLTYILGHIGAAGNAKRSLKMVVCNGECSTGTVLFFNVRLYVTQLYAHRHAQVLKKTKPWVAQENICIWKLNKNLCSGTEGKILLLCIYLHISPGKPEVKASPMCCCAALSDHWHLWSVFPFSYQNMRSAMLRARFAAFFSLLSQAQNWRVYAVAHRC